MSDISQDQLQVLALLQGVLTTYAPEFVLPVPDGILSFSYRLVMELVRDCLTKYHQGRISSEYLEHLQQNIRTLVQQAEEKSQSGDLAFFKQLAQKVLYVLEHPARSVESLDTSEGDSKEEENLNIPDPDTAQPGLSPDLTEGITVTSISDGGICETPEIVHESANDTSEGDSKEEENLNMPDPDTAQPGLSPDLTEGITVTAITDGGICETPEIVHESANAVIGSLDPGRNPCRRDFKRVKLISFGAFGTIQLVRHKDTKQICAMKNMDKKNMKKADALELAFLERDISTFADCPFVVPMFCSFPSELDLCMVMEYLPGGDCDSLLKYHGRLPVTLARLYIAETVQAVEYLHSYGVVHRDLKPDNLMITSTGHIKVTDFGLSKLGLMRPTSDVYKTPTEDITREFLDNEAFGTPYYIAPEVFLTNGYGRPVDWWSIGIILYEFLFGFVPFRGASERELLQSILNDDITWNNDNYTPPREAQDIITELLRKNPLHRLGTEGANEIKHHLFFRDLDFDNLLSQKPLIVPDLKSEEDTCYFNTRCGRRRHMNSDKTDTTEDNDWPDMNNFLSSSPRFSKLFTTNTSLMTKDMSPPGCSSENTEKHSDVQKVVSSSKTDEDIQCLADKNGETPSLSKSPDQKRRRFALRRRKERKAEKAEEGESRRGSVFRRIISSCRRGLSRAARAIRESCICGCFDQGAMDLSMMEDPYM